MSRTDLKAFLKALRDSAANDAPNDHLSFERAREKARQLGLADYTPGPEPHPIRPGPTAGSRMKRKPGGSMPPGLNSHWVSLGRFRR